MESKLACAPSFFGTKSVASHPLLLDAYVQITKKHHQGYKGWYARAWSIMERVEKHSLCRS